MADDQHGPEYPFGNFYFALEIDGVEIAHFLEASGLATRAEAFEIQEGGMNGAVHTRPGRSKWENIVLKKAVHTSQELWNWRERYLRDEFGSRPTTTGSIILYANDGEQISRWSFLSAFPVSWSGPEFNAGGSDLAVETLEISHEGIAFGDGGSPTVPPAPVVPPQPRPPVGPPPPPAGPLNLPPIQFDYNSSTLTPEGKKVCKEAAEKLDAIDCQEVWIEGHTCTMGTFAYNQSLSADRARSVANEVRAQSTKPRTYHSEGFSWKYPKSPNNSTAGKESNRRSEVYPGQSWGSRGRNTDPVPDSQKTKPPWRHT